MNNNILTYLRIKKSMEKPPFQHNQINIQNKTYVVNSIFYDEDQEEIFQNISRNILMNCLQGYNCSVFAYGQTGSGKTYTIQGTNESPGLVQRTLAFLHEKFDEIKLSFIEIYNENMVDLSNPSDAISIREDPADGVTVDNLNIKSSNSLETSLEFYRQGIRNRKTASTPMNDESSRSHSVFTVRLEIKNKNIIKKSKLSFVDLAGSEKINEHEVDRAKETCNINTSLLCLGKIVHKLSSNERWHISYRDSKLTFLLKDSLGGNCKLAIIGTVNLNSIPDTINTLNFLQRSRMICNTPSINYHTVGSTIEELTENLKTLDERNNALEAELNDLRKVPENGERAALLYELKTLKSNFGVLSCEFYKIVDMLAEKNSRQLETNKMLLLDINESLKTINQRQKEYIKNIYIKKRKLEGEEQF